jgi:hypothetical protein
MSRSGINYYEKVKLLNRRLYRESPGSEYQNPLGVAGVGYESFACTYGQRKTENRKLKTILQTRSRRSSPTKTFSVLERSPIILRTGSGSLRTRVGMARI